jgi:photosystem II stability/assembly factor-like uncharacterized protein
MGLLPKSVRCALVFVALLLLRSDIVHLEFEEPTESHEALEWFLFQREYPFESVPVEARREAFEALPRSFESLDVPGAVWKSVGPAPTLTRFTGTGPASGRIDALAVSPADPRIVLAGGESGGIWRSTDGGTTFQPVTDDQVDLNIGTIVFSKSNPEIVYAGMGNLLYLGTGILKSMDGGLTWNRVSNGTLPAPGNARSLLVDPFDSNHLFAGLYSYAVTSTNQRFAGGIFVSTDGAVSWRNLLPGLPTDLVFDPNDSKTLYAAMQRVDRNGFTPGIYRSTDQGQTWSQVLPSPFTINSAMKVAVSKSNPLRLAAMVTGRSGSEPSEGRVFVSSDGGQQWTDHGATDFDAAGITSFLYIDPDRPDHFYFGGFDLQKTTDAGVTWTNLTTNYRIRGRFNPSEAKTHADMQSMAFSTVDPNKLFVGTDGGLWISTDGGDTFSQSNSTFSLTQFYGLTLHPTDPGVSFGGAQDNGLQLRSSGQWTEIITGDGGPVVVDYSDPRLAHFIVNGEVYTRNVNGGISKVGSKSTFGEGTTNRVAFVPPLAGNQVDSTLYYGSWRLFTSTDRGTNWTAPAGQTDLTKGSTDVLSVIAVAPKDPSLIYTGSAQGQVMFSRDAGVTWTVSTTGLPNRFIRSIAFDPVTTSTAYLTVSGFGSGHVFKTSNNGVNWVDISANLPNVPVNALLVDPLSQETIYVGTDIGVFRTRTAGTTWSSFNAGLPPVIVSALTSQAAGLIQVATYGRGVYELDTRQTEEFDAIIGSGLVFSRASSGQGGLSVGYAQLYSTVNSPVALANFGFTQNGVLVTETGVPAAAALQNVRFFVDLTTRSNSGLAVVNPGATPLAINAILRNNIGVIASTTSFTLGSHKHMAMFVDQLFPGLKPPFLGTLTMSATGGFAAINLSSAVNGYGETIFSALPVVNLDRPSAGDRLILPHLVDGGGFATEVLLLNPSSIPASGTISFFNDNGDPLTLSFVSGTQTSTISYSMPPDGMMNIATTGNGPLRTGYATINVSQGSLPASNGIFLSNENGLTSQAGVPVVAQTNAASVFVERSTLPLVRDTGVALVNPNATAATITASLIGINGELKSTTIALAPRAHSAKFISELFPDLSRDFQGGLTLTSNVPISALTLRLTQNQRGQSIYSTLPIADLNSPPTGAVYVPQIADGGGYTTQIILVNTANSPGAVHVDFYDSSGKKVVFR